MIVRRVPMNQAMILSGLVLLGWVLLAATRLLIVRREHGRNSTRNSQAMESLKGTSRGMCVFPCVRAELCKGGCTHAAVPIPLKWLHASRVPSGTARIPFLGSRMSSEFAGRRAKETTLPSTAYDLRLITPHFGGSHSKNAGGEYVFTILYPEDGDVEHLKINKLTTNKLTTNKGLTFLDPNIGQMVMVRKPALYAYYCRETCFVYDKCRYDTRLCYGHTRSHYWRIELCRVCIQTYM